MLTLIMIALTIGGMAAGAGIATAYFMLTQKPARVADFKCPYCRLLVIGSNNLDIAAHMTCITKSAEDIEADLKRRELESKRSTINDDYFIDTRIYTKRYVSDFPERRRSAAFLDREKNGYSVIETIVYRNGEPIKTVYSQNEKRGNELGLREIEIDKHKRKRHVSISRERAHTVLNQINTRRN